MSVSNVNVGSQILTWDYRQKASSSSFNRLYSDIVPTGIYDGGKLKRLSDTVISVEKMTVLIKSNERQENKITVRIETTTDQDLSLANSSGSCDPSNSYIVARFGWMDVENDFMEFLAVKYSDNPAESRPNYLQEKDIIIGKVLYEQQGANWIIKGANSFDYTRRDDIAFVLTEKLYNGYRVQTCEEDPNKIHVTPGVTYNTKGTYLTEGGNYPQVGGIPATGPQGRWDLVYVNSDGVIGILPGQASANPTAPAYGGRKVIAEIRRGPNRNDIIGDDIYRINIFGQAGTIEPSSLSLIDSNNYFTEKNIEGALKQTWEKTNALQSFLNDLKTYAENLRGDFDSHENAKADDSVVHGIEIVTEIEPLVYGEEAP